MSTYLLTIESAEPDSFGIRLVPGIRLSDAAARPAIGRMMQGDILELHQTDGRITKTSLVSYGVSVYEKDGAFYLYDDPSDSRAQAHSARRFKPIRSSGRHRSLVMR